MITLDYVFPGVDPHDVNVEVQANTLLIGGLYLMIHVIHGPRGHSL